ncbi:MAG: hypothetical protein ACRDYX_12275 [Egibacteraceae bacterium]
MLIESLEVIDLQLLSESDPVGPSAIALGCRITNNNFRCGTKTCDGTCFRTFGNN